MQKFSELIVERCGFGGSFGYEESSQKNEKTLNPDQLTEETDKKKFFNPD